MTDEHVPMVYFWRGWPVAGMSREALVEAIIQAIDELHSHVDVDLGSDETYGEPTAAPAPPPSDQSR
jgi:hypothetical protein